MKSSGLFAEIKNHPMILALVILLHIGLAVMLSISLSDDEKPPMPAAKKHNIINAVMVDAKKFDERKKQEKHAAEKLVADKKRQKELERKKALEKKRLAEKKKKQLVLAKKKEQERLKNEKLAAEKKLREKKAREKKEAERKKQEKLEAERKRKVEEERQRRAEEKAEFERALLEEERREEEARKQLERAARLQTQREQYTIQITQKVENSWLRPATTVKGQSCDVIVTQTMMGDVIDVRLTSCTGDNAFQRSVERAVRKASPLPKPPNPDVFDREIHFTFKPRL